MQVGKVNEVKKPCLFEAMTTEYEMLNEIQNPIFRVLNTEI